MNIFNLFRKPPESRFRGQRATVGRAVAGDAVRLAARRARLRKALGRAEGERKAALQAELAAIESQFEAMRAALEES